VCGDIFKFLYTTGFYRVHFSAPFYFPFPIISSHSSSVCVVSCPDVLQCLCCVLPWRVTMIMLCGTRYSVCVVMCPDVLQCVVSYPGVFWCLYCVVPYYNVCVVSCPGVLHCLCCALKCSYVCVVSYPDMLQCFVPWRVTVFVSCLSLVCSNALWSHSFWKVIYFFQWSLNLASLLEGVRKLRLLLYDVASDVRHALSHLFGFAVPDDVFAAKGGSSKNCTELGKMSFRLCWVIRRLRTWFVMHIVSIRHDGPATSVSL
jgi:hypothetical protein